MTTKLSMEETLNKAIVELSGICISFGALQVIRDVSLNLHEGELLSLIGPNGAGKTTLIGAIGGHLPVASGTIRYEGKDITKWKPDKRARTGIGRSFQKTNLFPQLSVLDNVKLAVLANRRIGPRQMLKRVAKGVISESQERLCEVGLEQHAHVMASSLSHGDKRKLEFATLLATKPRVLLLDEPTAGMSMAEAPGVLDLIARLKKSGQYAMLLVEHKLDVVMRLSDRVAVLNQGGLLLQGTPFEVMENPEVERAYLGGHYARKT